ncbi:MAG TPA: hypothetical protein VNZ27_08640 [Rhodanobacter sp.]|jgi:hypothetical protein|nr:hypothetical protein [Rhodanobacter sp.]
MFDSLSETAVRHLQHGCAHSAKRNAALARDTLAGIVSFDTLSFSTTLLDPLRTAGTTQKRRGVTDD